MRLQGHRNGPLKDVLPFHLLFFLAPSLVSSITVSSPAELQASAGDTVTLSCTFTSTSRPTSKMTIDWSYRPQTGGPPQTFFHFSSRAFPPLEGRFSGRIQWRGSPAKGEASIVLINSTLNDNGTYTCSVRNPPDVHGNPNSHTVLTVMPKIPSIRFSDVAVLLFFVLIPSTIITLILIGQMLFSERERSQSKGYRSPIEVAEGEEYDNYRAGNPFKAATCCDLALTDSESELDYSHMKQNTLATDGYAESQF